MLTRGTLVIAFILLLGATAWTRDSMPCGPPGGPDWAPRRGLIVLPSVGLSGNTGFYGSVAIIAGHKPPRCGKCGNARFSSGVLLEADIGPNAGRAAVGYATVNPLLFGLGVKVVAERQWQAARSVQPGDLFAGPEASIRVSRVIVTTGVVGRVSGSGAKRARWIWGIGLGL